MSRRYTQVKVLETEIMDMKRAGKINREIAEHFGFEDKYVVKGLVKRRNRKERCLCEGIELRSKGRPRKGCQSLEEGKDNEIKRLKMENELLRDFLRHVGRGQSHQ